MLKSSDGFEHEPPLLVIDVGTTVIAVPVALTRGAGGVEVGFQVVVLQGIAQ